MRRQEAEEQINGARISELQSQLKATKAEQKRVESSLQASVSFTG